MRDQAAELRNLVLKAARQGATELGPAPRLAVLTGGKGGVGTTTLAVNLSVALSQQGARVVLVDADLNRPDVATLCGVTEAGSVVDVLTARQDIHEVLQRGPAGIQIVPGMWAAGGVVDCGEKAQRRLIDQLKTLGRHAEIVVLDIGSGPSELARRFWKAADDVLLVTTPDQVAVMDSYATIKALANADNTAAIRIVVSQADDAEAAADVHRRIDQSCRRFLQITTTWLGHVPSDPRVSAAARAAMPLLVTSPTCPAAREIERMAAVLAASEVKRATNPAVAQTKRKAV